MTRSLDNVVVFDTETTGTDAQIDQVIELSIQVGLGEGAASHTWRFLPTVPINAEAQQVHGISLEDLQGEPAFAERAAEIVALLQGAEVLVGYNIRFDIDMVAAELKRAALPPLALNAVTVIDPFRLWQRSEPRSLADAHRRFVGGDFDGAHSAAADVAATGRVLLGMIEGFGLGDNDWDAIATIAEPERARWIGPSHHLMWSDNGQVAFGFGKYAGEELYAFTREQRGRGYVEWMLQKDFPAHVRDVLGGLRDARSVDVWTAAVREKYGHSGQ